MGLTLVSKATSVSAKEIVGDKEVSYTYVIQNGVLTHCSAMCIVQNGVTHSEEEKTNASVTVFSSDGVVFSTSITDDINSDFSDVVESMKANVAAIFQDPDIF